MVRQSGRTAPIPTPFGTDASISVEYDCLMRSNNLGLLQKRDVTPGSVATIIAVRGIMRLETWNCSTDVNCFRNGGRPRHAIFSDIRPRKSIAFGFSYADLECHSFMQSRTAIVRCITVRQKANSRLVVIGNCGECIVETPAHGTI